MHFSSRGVLQVEEGVHWIGTFDADEGNVEFH